MSDPVCCFCMKAYDGFYAEQCWQCGDITCPNCISEEGTCPDCFKQDQTNSRVKPLASNLRRALDKPVDAGLRCIKGVSGLTTEKEGT